MSVKYEGKEYGVIKKGGVLALDLSGKEIKDITEISGLETLTDLQVLNLSKNQISEIKGLETLKNLLTLDLSHNVISEIQGLKNLINLRRLNLEGNRFVTIKGFENLINLESLTLGLSHWDLDKVIRVGGVYLRRPSLREGGYLTRNGSIDIRDRAPLILTRSDRSPLIRPDIILNGRELSGAERYAAKGGAKKVVAYCRVRLRQLGLAEGLVPADRTIERLEGKIEKVIKKHEKLVKKAMNEKRKKEIIRREDQRYSKDYGPMR